MKKSVRISARIGCIALVLVAGILNSLMAQTVGTSISDDGALPNSNAMLDIQSPGSGDGKGLLIPRITCNQRTNAQASLAGGLLNDSGELRGGAAPGLMVYQTDETQGLYYNTSTTVSPTWFFAGAGGDFKADGSVPMTGPLTSSSTISADQYFNTNNTVSGLNAVALGGSDNAANGRNSVVGGGVDNLAHGVGSVIAGGSNNMVLGTSSVIVGGYSNRAGDASTDQYAFIGGGRRNEVLDHHSSIVGGLQNRITQEYSAIGGGRENEIVNTYSFIGGGQNNEILARHNAIGGGRKNLIDSGDIYGFIGGGESNRIHNDRCFIGSGRGNVASNIYVTIGGGDMNTCKGDSGFIGGGWTNWMGSADAGVITGGRGNMIYNNCDYSVIPGGRNNIISNSADYAFAAGLGARARHDGTFVWADHNTSLVESTAENQFICRASGGYVFYSANNTTTGAQLPAGSGSWSSLSDRNLKKRIEPLDGQQVLEKLSTLPIHTWSYLAQADDIRHAGPMAQDFYAAFGLGEDNRHISNVDPDGIALAAIQGLYTFTCKENEELKAIIQAQALALDAIQARLSQLEKNAE